MPDGLASNASRSRSYSSRGSGGPASGSIPEDQAVHVVEIELAHGDVAAPRKRERSLFEIGEHGVEVHRDWFDCASLLAAVGDDAQLRQLHAQLARVGVQVLEHQHLVPDEPLKPLIPAAPTGGSSSRSPRRRGGARGTPRVSVLLAELGDVGRPERVQRAEPGGGVAPARLLDWLAEKLDVRQLRAGRSEALAGRVVRVARAAEGVGPGDGHARERHLRRLAGRAAERVLHPEAPADHTQPLLQLAQLDSDHTLAHRPLFGRVAAATHDQLGWSLACAKSLGVSTSPMPSTSSGPKVGPLTGASFTGSGVSAPSDASSPSPPETSPAGRAPRGQACCEGELVGVAGEDLEDRAQSPMPTVFSSSNSLLVVLYLISHRA